jgi:predicted aconitase with swiveling domain
MSTHDVGLFHLPVHAPLLHLNLGDVKTMLTDTAHNQRREQQATLDHLDDLARLLDSAITIPGTRITLGADAIAGVVPVIGPLLTSSVSAYIVAQAWRHGAPPGVLARMGANIVGDTMLSSIPVIGFIGDMFFKANRRNMDLLRHHLGQIPHHEVRTR